MESARDFLDSIEDFLKTKAHTQACARGKLGMPPGTSKNDLEEWKQERPDLEGRMFVISIIILLKHLSKLGQGFSGTDCKTIRGSTSSIR